MRFVDRVHAVLVVTFLAGALAGCGDGDDEEGRSTGTASGSGAAGGSGGPTGAGGAGGGGGAVDPCESVSLQGTLNGQDVDVAFDSHDYGFSQDDLNGSQFTIGFGAEASGQLELHWQGVEFEEIAFDVVGSLLLPSDGPNPGATLCAGSGSTLLYEKEMCGGQEVTHYVAELVSVPSGRCSGPGPVEGSIVFEHRH